MGSSGPTPPPRSGPSSPPPALIGGRVNLSRNRGARDFLRKLVLGKDVTLEFDDAGGRADVPRVYVFLDDGTLVNSELLREGRARVDESVPIARLDEFKRIESEARNARRGVGPSELAGQVPRESEGLSACASSTTPTGLPSAASVCGKRPGGWRARHRG